MNYTYQLCPSAEGSVNLLMDDRLPLVTVQDVNIHVVLPG